MSKTVSVRDITHFGQIRYAAQDALAQAGLSVKLSHANEAAARGLGHRTLAALNSTLRSGTALCTIDDAGFRARLTEFGYAPAPEGLFAASVAETVAHPAESVAALTDRIMAAIEAGRYRRSPSGKGIVEHVGEALAWDDIRNDLSVIAYREDVYQGTGLPTLRVTAEVSARLDVDDLDLDRFGAYTIAEAISIEKGNSDPTAWNTRVVVEGGDGIDSRSLSQIESALIEHGSYGYGLDEEIRVYYETLIANNEEVECESEEDAWARYEGYCDRVQVVTGIHQTGCLMIGEEEIVTDPRDVLTDIDPREPGHREWWEDYGRRHHDATVALTKIGSMLTELTGDSRVLARAAEEVLRAEFAETSDGDYEGETANLESLAERWGMLTDLDALRADEAVAEKAKAMAWPEITTAIAEAMTYADIDGIADTIADAVTADGQNGVEGSVIGSVRIAALVTRQAEAVIDDFDLADDATVIADEVGISDDEIRARALTEARRRITAAVHERLGAGLDRAVRGIGSDSVAL